MSADAAFLAAAIARMQVIKGLGEGALAQVSDAQLFRQSDPEANSIAIIVCHLRGNMLSRWTDFLTSDGEKPGRQRDREFEPTQLDRQAVLAAWEQGWACTLGALQALKPADVLRQVTIRGEPMTAMDAIIRQIGHYSYHVGQMVTLAREQLGPRWQTLSIARGQSKAYKPKARAGGIRE